MRETERRAGATRWVLVGAGAAAAVLLGGCAGGQTSTLGGTATAATNDDGGAATPDPGVTSPPWTAPAGDAAPGDGASAPSADLTSLSVAPLTLTPAFSASVHDYAVRCAAGTNALTLDVTASAGVLLTVDGGAEGSSSGVTQLQTTVSLAEDAAATIVTTVPSGEQARYFVRCLPHDFPAMTVNLHPERGAPTPGWYVMGNGVIASGSGGFAMILDTNGTPVWYRRSTLGAVDVEALSANTLFYAPQIDGWYTDSTAGMFQVIDLSTGTTSSVGAIDTFTDHHDLVKLPGGNWLTLSFPVTTGVDLSALPAYATESTIFDCQMQEVDPSGNVVWRWLASEHFDAGRESTFPARTTVGGHSAVDTFHCNSMEVADDGDIMMSARHMDAVFLVSKATSKVTWKLGGTPSNKDGAQILTAEAPFYRQHDARFLPGGHITLFDDHTQMSGVARGVEYALDLAAGTAAPVFEYAGVASSTAMGSFRRYASGASIIGWGMLSGGPNTAFTEIDSAGNAVLDVELGASNFTYRAVKAEPSMFDADVLRRTAGLP